MIPGFPTTIVIETDAILAGTLSRSDNPGWVKAVIPLLNNEEDGPVERFITRMLPRWSGEVYDVLPIADRTALYRHLLFAQPAYILAVLDFAGSFRDREAVDSILKLIRRRRGFQVSAEIRAVAHLCLAEITGEPVLE